MRFSRLWICTLLLLLPSVLTAQHSRDEPSSLNGAVAKLMEHRDQLALSAEQLTRVQAIRDSTNAQNRPAWQQIMAVRRGLKARRAAEPDMPEAQETELVRQSFAEIRRLSDQIDANEHWAMRKVGKVLTQTQRDMVAQIIEQSRDDDRRRGDSGRRGNGRN